VEHWTSKIKTKMSVFKSVAENDSLTLKRLIADGADVNATDEHGHTALRAAGLECAAMLLDAKADPNKCDDSDGSTPLLSAIINTRTEVVRLLIRHKANVNAHVRNGISVMHYAAGFGNETCIHLLAATGAEVDGPDIFDRTPLAYAILWDHLKIAEVLLHLGAKMKNINSGVRRPAWLIDIIAKRRNVMSSTLALKGMLKRRLGLSKDISNLIVLHFWRIRLLEEEGLTLSIKK
jgi:ankyrin repeat protein